MPIRKYLSEMIERKTHEALHEIECYKNRMLSEMGDVDKETLTKLREILARGGTGGASTSHFAFAELLKPIQSSIDTLTKNAESTDAARGYVTPEMYGAIGDGVTDDTNALQQACSCALPVLLTREYKVTQGITVTAPAVIGTNARINAGANMESIITAPPFFTIEGVIINGSEYAVNHALYAPNNVDIVLENVHVVNIINPAYSTAIRIVNGVVNIRNTTVNDVYATANGTQGDRDGAAYGITAHNYSYFNAENVRCENIHSVDENGGILFEDSAAIYIQSFDVDALSIFRGCTAGNVGKYGYKSQAYNVFYDTCVVFNDCDDFKDGFVCLPASGDYSPRVYLNKCRVIDTRNYKSTENAYAVENHVNIYVENMDFGGVAIGGISNNTASGECVLNNCTFDGNGVVNFNKLTANNCVFRGGHVATCYRAEPNARFVNCEFITYDNAVALYTYKPFDFTCHVEFINCDFSLHLYGAITTYAGANITFENCNFAYSVATHSLIRCINGATSVFRNCTVDTTGASNYSIEVNGNSEFINVTVRGDKRVLRVSGGTLQTDLCPSLIVWQSTEAIDHMGKTYMALPTLPTYTPDNVYALLLTDGKVYKTQTRKWVAIN